MKITVTLRKPRNPLVAASRFRLAGAHGCAHASRRQQARRALREELERMRHDSP